VSAVNKTCGSCVQHLGRTAAEQRSRWPTEAFRIPESSYSKWAKKSGRWVVEWVVCGLWATGGHAAAAAEILLPTFWGGGDESLS